MPSFISSQRQNVDRLLALILLWNVAAGAFVTLGAPWLSEMAGTTALRPDLPSGRGWLAIGVPTHFAGLWLPALGVYALFRMRRHLPWHLPAVLFYAPQTFAITSPAHIDLWMGLFATTSFYWPSGAAIAFNGIAVTLILAHSVLALLDSKYRAHVERTGAAVLGLCRDSLSRSMRARTAVLSRCRDLWSTTRAYEQWVPAPVLSLWRRVCGTPPLSRSGLALRYATSAMITAVVLLPFLPPDIFYPSQQTSPMVEPHWFDKKTVMLWRKLLLLPMTFVIAYVMAVVWSGRQREPRFSGRRGFVAAMLSYVYLGLATDLLSRWLSDGTEPWFRYFVLGLMFFLPFNLLVPTVGAIAGERLGRKVAAAPDRDQHRDTRLTAGMWLTLVTPLLALLLSYALDAPDRQRIEAARRVAQRALEHFDQKQPEQLYEMFTAESKAMIDRDDFIATVRERRDSLGELQDGDARDEVRHDWYPRAGIIQFNFNRAGTRWHSSESIVIDVRDPTPMLSAVFMSFGGKSQEDNLFVPRHRACRDNQMGVLHCGGFDERPPRSLF